MHNAAKLFYLASAAGADLGSIPRLALISWLPGIREERKVMKKREDIDTGIYWDQAIAMICQALLLIDCLLDDASDLTDDQRNILSNARSSAGDALTELV